MCERVKKAWLYFVKLKISNDHGLKFQLRLWHYSLRLTIQGNFERYSFKNAPFLDRNSFVQFYFIYTILCIHYFVHTLSGAYSIYVYTILSIHYLVHTLFCAYTICAYTIFCIHYFVHTLLVHTIFCAFTICAYTTLCVHYLVHTLFYA